MPERQHGQREASNPLELKETDGLLIRGLTAWLFDLERGGVRPSKAPRFQNKLGGAAL